MAMHRLASSLLRPCVRPSVAFGPRVGPSFTAVAPIASVPHAPAAMCFAPQPRAVSSAMIPRMCFSSDAQPQQPEQQQRNDQLPSTMGDAQNKVESLAAKKVTLTGLLAKEYKEEVARLPVEIPPPPNGFQITEANGGNEVILRRMRGKEEIVIEMSTEDISDPMAGMPEEDELAERAKTIADELEAAGQPVPEHIQEMISNAAKKQDLADAEEDVHDLQTADQPDLPQQQQQQGQGTPNREEQLHLGFRVHVIKKNQPGAPTMTFSCQTSPVTGHDFQVVGMKLFDKAEKAIGDDAENIVGRVKVHEAPGFDALPYDLRESLRGYLLRRGVDASTAAFMFDYAQYKEHKEYVHFIKSARDFFRL